eukprot:3389548-Ditylum_brightwellii.AAC.1
MSAPVTIIFQFSASDDVLNWQLRMSLVKTWKKVGAFTMCCKKSCVLAPSSTGLSLANQTLIPVADSVH